MKYIRSKYEVIDNALTDVDFAGIKAAILAQEFPWFMADNVAHKNEKEKHFYFLHTLYDYLRPQSKYYMSIMPLVHKLKIRALLRVKCNNYINTGKLIVHEKHRDYPYKHKGAIFYLNTNNGFTILENGDKIESIENRLLLFDSSTPHSSTTCTDKTSRINININYF
tara:strand:+ start:305 stop:805 length:501 start_codon:yes stop_codon:yes gene_type:complete